jgi:hypothetical protein
MPRDGALTLSDVRSPTLAIVCEPCARRGRYAVARLLEEHNDAKLTDLLVTLANCPKARSTSVHDRCKAVYEGLATRWRPGCGLPALGRLCRQPKNDVAKALTRPTQRP